MKVRARPLKGPKNNFLGLRVTKSKTLNWQEVNSFLQEHSLPGVFQLLFDTFGFQKFKKPFL